MDFLCVQFHSTIKQKELAFIKDKKAFYFFADKQNENLQIERFKNQIAENFKDEILKNIALSNRAGGKSEKILRVITIIMHKTTTNCLKSLLDVFLVRSQIFNEIGKKANKRNIVGLFFVSNFNDQYRLKKGGLYL